MPNERIDIKNYLSDLRKLIDCLMVKVWYDIGWMPKNSKLQVLNRNKCIIKKFEYWWKINQQAGAEIGQAQPQLGLRLTNA